VTVQKKLRELLNRKEATLLPGAVNAMFAHVVEDLGFEAVYATGAGISNTQLGLADVGLISMGEVLNHVRYMCEAVQIPLICDIDTGFGNALNVYRTVRQFEKAGCAGLQIEDQVTPKKCGHFAGKAVVDVEEMEIKIKAALDARQSDVVIIARTDAIAVEGFDRAIERAQRYREAGADMIFVEAPRSMEEIQAIPKLVAAPLIINMVEGGLTPLLNRRQVSELGYTFMLHANFPLKAAVKGIQDALIHLRDSGQTEDIQDKIITTDERNRLTKYEHLQELQRRYKLL
jgi:methylisocitrate lyase